MSFESVVVRHGIPMPLELKLPRKFWLDVGALFVDSVTELIWQQQQAQGGRIKANAPSTLAAKRMRGSPLKSLIDRDKDLVNRRGYKIESIANGVTVSFAVNKGRLVQEKGYVGWFAPGPRYAAAFRNRLTVEIQNAAKRAAKRRSTLKGGTR